MQPICGRSSGAGNRGGRWVRHSRKKRQNDNRVCDEAGKRATRRCRCASSTRCARVVPLTLETAPADTPLISRLAPGDALHPDVV